MAVRIRLRIFAATLLVMAVSVGLVEIRLCDALTRSGNALESSGLLVDTLIDLKCEALGLLEDPVPSAMRHWEVRFAAIESSVSKLTVAKEPDRLIVHELTSAVRDLGQIFRSMGELILRQSDLRELVNTVEGQGLLVGVDEVISPARLLMESRKSELAKERSVGFRWLTALVVLFLGVLVLTAMLISRPIAIGIEELTEGTRRIADGDLDYRIEVLRNDELGAVADFFNRMADELSRAQESLKAECSAHVEQSKFLRISNQELESAKEKLLRAHGELMQQERFLALKQVFSGTMRDFNEALTPIIGISEMVKSEESTDPEEIMEYVGMIHASATRATTVIKRISQYFGPHDQAPMEAVDMVSVAGMAIDLTRPLWKEQRMAANVRIEMETDLESVSPVQGDPDSLRDLVSNLILNAVEALPEGGRLRIATHMDGEDVVLTVEDSGLGMDEETKRSCFEPFFTTKEDSSGMGLTVALGIAKRHHGEVSVQSEPGVGTIMTLRIPRSSLVADPPAPKSAGSASLPSLAVLAVDDDPDVLRMVCRMLRKQGHVVVTASSGAEAFRILSAARFDIVLTDRGMSDMSGDELARRAKERFPDTPVLMITGFGASMKDRGECPDGVDLILNKPFTRDELFRAIAELVPTMTEPQ